MTVVIVGLGYVSSAEVKSCQVRKRNRVKCGSENVSSAEAKSVKHLKDSEIMT